MAPGPALENAALLVLLLTHCNPAQSQMPTRRMVLRALAFATTAPLLSVAQHTGRVWRVGFLALRRPLSLESDQFGGFSRGMSELGYVEGKNLLIEWRFADGEPDQLPVLAADLVRSKVDVIVAAGTQAISATRKTTTIIPIVMAGANDPVGSGFVASLAHPGGNVTGLSLLLEDITPKQLDILLIMIPRLSRLALLANPANVSYSTLQARLEAAARNAKVELITARAGTPLEIESAFAVLTRGRADAVVVASDALFSQEVRRIALLAERNRLPLIGPFRQYPEAGALLSYGQNFTDHFRRAATYVDKIIKGANPGDLPVEQPTKLELIINLKTARLFGLVMPPELLLRADESIDQ